MNTKNVHLVLVGAMITVAMACSSPAPADQNAAAAPDFGVAVEFMNAYTAYRQAPSAGPEADAAWMPPTRC